ncbi:3-dehydroquinate synthase [Spirochaetia bacterium]|nr:3-dehydroquinate synthase [Spirochaetia bacterium]
MNYTFDAFETSVHIRGEIPGIAQIAADMGAAIADNGSGIADNGARAADGFFKPLIVCDEHTAPIADRICAVNGAANGAAGGDKSALPRCVITGGEAAKAWPAVESILRAAREAGLGRDGVFIGVGGGVIGDLTAFAASIYMRGCGLVLVSTTLLGMVDASLGGKTGFDLFGIKNLAGTFYPARHVYMPLESLASLPAAEWKSGMAELIKTAILDGDDFLDELTNTDFAGLTGDTERLCRCVSRAVHFKGRIVAADPRESAVWNGGPVRVLLNLGHTFGHALESAAGLGTISHGEAVAWGIARACELGLVLGITPQTRAKKIKALLAAYGYETAAPHPLMGNEENFLKALGDDKKKKSGKLSFIVPDEKSARPLTIASHAEMGTIKQLLKGELPL